LTAGGVFFWEGIRKFVYASQGIGHITKLGMPPPHFTADFVACLEIVGGLLVLSGWWTRLIAIPFLVEMIVAILSTKISLYLGRSEYAQLQTVAFLMINGPGKWSADAVVNRKQENRSQVVAASRRKESANASVMV
jgi:putative oxidoreductase